MDEQVHLNPQQHTEDGRLLEDKVVKSLGWDDTVHLPLSILLVLLTSPLNVTTLVQETIVL